MNVSRKVQKKYKKRNCATITEKFNIRQNLIFFIHIINLLKKVCFFFLFNLNGSIIY